MPKILLLSFALAGGLRAGAQSNSVPGPTDYPRFSRFISERNIFDPNRYPRGTTPVHHSYPHARSAPAFTLVGTMTYEKGMFAFFSGNNSDLKKILTLNGGIAGYTVAKITLSGVTLQGADKKEIELKIGGQMREENDGWQLAAQDDVPAGTSGMANAAAGGTGSSAAAPAGSPPVAPSASVSNNDVLKRLMQQREQENK